jgi:hypothetical protein
MLCCAMSKSASEQLVRVEGPDFTAALVMRDGVCVEAAPVIAWTVGKKASALWFRFGRRGWRTQVIG